MKDSGCDAPQEDVMTNNVPICLSDYRHSAHFWGAIATNGTLSLIKAGDHCNARDNFNILQKAGVRNLSSLPLKFVDENCPFH